MNKLVIVATLALAACAAGQTTQSKPAAAPATTEAKKLAPELLPAEVRQLERMADLYEEYAQQMAEAQTRVKVIQELQAKLNSELNNFQVSAIAARGYKPGEAVLDLQQRKVTPIAAPKSEK